MKPYFDASALSAFRPVVVMSMTRSFSRASRTFGSSVTVSLLPAFQVYLDDGGLGDPCFKHIHLVQVCAHPLQDPSPFCGVGEGGA